MEKSREPAGRADEEVAGQAISQIVVPAVTVAPTSTDRPETVPARWAGNGCSIFIGLTGPITAASETVSPFWAATFHVVPCIGGVSAGAPPSPAVLVPDPEGRAWGRAGVTVRVPERLAGRR